MNIESNRNPRNENFPKVLHEKTDFMLYFIVGSTGLEPAPERGPTAGLWDGNLAHPKDSAGTAVPQKQTQKRAQNPTKKTRKTRAQNYAKKTQQGRTGHPTQKNAAGKDWTSYPKNAAGKDWTSYPKTQQREGRTLLHTEEGGQTTRERGCRESNPTQKTPAAGRATLAKKTSLLGINLTQRLSYGCS